MKKSLELLAKEVAKSFKENGGYGFHLFFDGLDKDGKGINGGAELSPALISDRHEIIYRMGKMSAQDEYCPIHEMHMVACAGEAYYYAIKRKKEQSKEDFMAKVPQMPKGKPKECLFICGMERSGQCHMVFYEIIGTGKKRTLKRNQEMEGTEQGQTYTGTLNNFWRGYMGL